MATRISKNFTLEELCASATAKAKGIRNVPNQEQVVNLCALVHNVLQPLRDKYKAEVKIGSGFRSPALNKAVGGVSNSQHMLGQEWCDFDQVIWEHNAKGTYWVHVSFRNDGKNRRQYIPNLLKTT